jgi:hypothetical protein
MVRRISKQPVVAYLKAPTWNPREIADKTAKTSVRLAGSVVDIRVVLIPVCIRLSEMHLNARLRSFV